MAPLVVIDIRAKAAESADAQVTPDDIKAWIAANGDIPEGAIVAMLSGWGAHVTTDKFRNVGADGKTMHFPGFHIEAAQHASRGPRPRRSPSTRCRSISASRPTSSSTTPGCRPAATASRASPISTSVPAKGATIVVGAPKVRGGTGGPARIFALV